MILYIEKQADLFHETQETSTLRISIGHANTTFIVVLI